MDATTDTSLPSPPTEHPLVHKADEIFERTSPYEGVGLLHHCRRLYHLTSLLMEARGVAFDPALAYFIAMVHDLGLVSERDEGRNYLHRSLALFHRETADMALPDEDPEVVEQCILYNHRVLSVPGLSPAAECFRNAVMIEHSRGLLRFGLPKERVKPVFERYPRGNFDRVLLDFTWRTIRREPLTLVSGIFL
ncbi:MAG: HD domain-containing protein [Myxococcales bacterium]|nr:HD domain-containing protein [Myxococcales bacterium]